MKLSKKSLEKLINRKQDERDQIIKLGSYKPANPGDLISPENTNQVRDMLERNIGLSFSTNDVNAKMTNIIKTFTIIMSDNNEITATNEIALKRYYEQLLASNVIAMIENSVIEITPEMVKDKGRIANKAVDTLIRKNRSSIELGEKFKNNVVSAGDLFKDIPIVNLMGISQAFQESASTSDGEKYRFFRSDDRYGSGKIYELTKEEIDALFPSGIVDGKINGFKIDSQQLDEIVVNYFEKGRGKEKLKRYNKLAQEHNETIKRFNEFQNKANSAFEMEQHRRKLQELARDLNSEMDEIAAKSGVFDPSCPVHIRLSSAQQIAYRNMVNQLVTNRQIRPRDPRDPFLAEEDIIEIQQKRNEMLSAVQSAFGEYEDYLARAAGSGVPFKLPINMQHFKNLYYSKGINYTNDKTNPLYKFDKKFTDVLDYIKENLITASDMRKSKDVEKNLKNLEAELEYIRAEIENDYEKFKSEEIGKLIAAAKSSTKYSEDPYVTYLGLNNKNDLFTRRNGETIGSGAQGVFDRFKDPRTHLEFRIASDLLMNSEILPNEFVDYVRRNLNLPLPKETEAAIRIKFGDGTKSNPFRLLDSLYTIDNRNSVLTLVNIIDGVNRRTGFDVGAGIDVQNRKAMKRAYKKIRNQGSDHPQRIFHRMVSLVGGGKNRVARLVNNIITKNKNAVKKNFEDTAFNTDYSFVVNNLEKSINNKTDWENKLKNYRTAELALKDIELKVERDRQPLPTLDAFAGQSFSNNNFDFNLVVENAEADVNEYLQLLQETTLTLERPIEIKAVNTYSVKKDEDPFLIPAYAIGNQLLYGTVEIDKDKNRSENRRPNEPIWLKIRFVERYSVSKNEIIDNAYATTIGIKAQIVFVPSEEFQYVFKSNVGTTPKTFNELKTSIFDRIKSDAGLSKIWRMNKDKENVLGSDTFNKNFENSAILSSVIVGSIREATSDISETAAHNYIKNPQLALKLMKKYNCGSICLVDSIQETYWMISNDSQSWERVPFVELERTNNKTNIDLNSLRSLR